MVLGSVDVWELVLGSVGSVELSWEMAVQCHSLIIVDSSVGTLAIPWIFLPAHIIHICKYLLA